MIRFLDFIALLVDAYKWLIIASVIVSWLLAFGLVNYSNQMVRQLWSGLNAVTEPVLGPIRRMLPNMGGLDLSPVVAIVLCWFINGVVIENLKDALR